VPHTLVFSRRTLDNRLKESASSAVLSSTVLRVAAADFASCSCRSTSDGVATFRIFLPLNSPMHVPATLQQVQTTKTQHKPSNEIISSTEMGLCGLVQVRVRAFHDKAALQLTANGFTRKCQANIGPVSHKATI
jgi:hypothetical protein